MQELWNKIIESCNSEFAKMTYLLDGLTTTVKGAVRENADGDKVNFYLEIDWSKCTFHYLVSLAEQTVRIRAQAKMRKDGMPTDGETVKVTVSEKEQKGVSVGTVIKQLGKLSDDDRNSLLEQLLKMQK